MSGIQNDEDLANAIIHQAAKDYIHALRTVKRRKNAQEALRTALETEAFFHSPWYRRLTQIDPDDMIEKLRKRSRFFWIRRIRKRRSRRKPDPAGIHLCHL